MIYKDDDTIYWKINHKLKFNKSIPIGSNIIVDVNKQGKIIAVEYIIPKSFWENFY